ncbi:MAG: response regulator [Candidatus Eisenbacteria bacterium]
MKHEPKILAVDDDRMNLSILKEILLDGGYVVSTASTGEEALEVAGRVNPDIVLLDIMMPGIDGYETCRRLRQGVSSRNCKIILVSAKAMVEERLKGYEAGADDYVVKPFDHDELVAKIEVFSRLKSIEEVDRLKDEFVSLLAHETRTPLTQIMAPAEILAGDAALSESDRRSFGEIVLKAARALDSKLKDVLLALLFRTKERDTPTVAAHLGEVLRDALQRTNAVDNCTLVEADAPSVLSDAGHLRIAFERLIEDSFQSGGGTALEIEIGTEQDQHQHVVVIEEQEGSAAEPEASCEFAVFEVPDLQHHTGAVDTGVPLANSIIRFYGGRLRVERYPHGFRSYRITLPAESPKDRSAVA